MIEENQKERSSLLSSLAYELKVAEVMTTNFIAVSPKDKMSDLREILRTKRISGTPVLEEGKLVGIISIEDLIKCLVAGEIDALIE